ncbi:KGK domain-containing protein [Argonema galeatum]|uniref:KGK domain-containing protein n=1 Tax=Argonema galeatum TaxID=2942762 RepID=UPI002012B1C5|nr:hypothetical protein [Argonema galeatum A003/A1]
MQDNYYLQDCGDDDVLSFGDETFKVHRFKTAINKSFDSSMGEKLTEHLKKYQGIPIERAVCPNNNYDEYAKWFKDGIDCEILNLGSKSWKKGKVKIKISLEFYAEEQETEKRDSSNQPEIPQPESPLDDLRQMLNQDNQQ